MKALTYIRRLFSRTLDNPATLRSDPFPSLKEEEEYELPQQATTTIFPGFGGKPHFPEKIGSLQRYYDDPSYVRDIEQLTEYARNINHFRFVKVLPAPETTGGLLWAVGYVFEWTGNGQAAVLFPPKNPEGKSGWHCAVYVRDGSTANPDRLAKLVDEFCSVIDD